MTGRYDYENIDKRIPSYFENIEDIISFYYFDEEGDAGIYTSVYVANFMLLLLSAIGICGIFADERINGTDQIIFSSVSKEKLFIAKILAGLSMAK